MDAKALAKSKRAHSQHHNKKPHSSQKSKAPADSSTDARNVKKSSIKQVGEKTRLSQRISALPSNWDRYEEEFDSDSKNPSGHSSNVASDVIMPKSKGADYQHLIDEARSQPQSNSYSDSLASFDDILPEEFKQGLGSMLAVRGERILSWIEDDDFLVEDRATTSHEATFLSLNLHALAEQLEKVDLAERLFIEPDLLPPELGAEGSKASCNQELEQLQTTAESSAATRMSEEIPVHDFADKVKIADKDIESTSHVSGSEHVESAISNPVSNLVNEVKDNATSMQFVESSQSRAQKSTEQFNVKSVTTSEKKLSTFEATAAEAELDMLLESLSETKVNDASDFKTGTPFTHIWNQPSRSLPQHLEKGLDSSKTAPTTAILEDVLDDLLEKTSRPGNQNGISEPQEVKAVAHEIQPSRNSVTKSKVLDDFESWLDTI